jgi:hypothetical protein
MPERSEESARERRREVRMDASTLREFTFGGRGFVDESNQVKLTEEGDDETASTGDEDGELRHVTDVDQNQNDNQIERDAEEVHDSGADFFRNIPAGRSETRTRKEMRGDRTRNQRKEELRTNLDRRVMMDGQNMPTQASKMKNMTRRIQ